ncbi:hypothetical protein LQZ19_11450 [Treponema primitia]|uniref:hypothetical protein n=1 Tax=Treponema primitia TaxID=88058 RepID=UPI00397F10E9
MKKQMLFVIILITLFSVVIYAGPPTPEQEKELIALIEQAEKVVQERFVTFQLNPYEGTEYEDLTSEEGIIGRVFILAGKIYDDGSGAANLAPPEIKNRVLMLTMVLIAYPFQYAMNKKE